MSVAVLQGIPIYADDPVECSQCEVVWVSGVKELRLRYTLGMDPRLCGQCFEAAREKATYQKRWDAHRCQCLGCGGHDGGCVERVYGKDARCRACVQWTLAEGVFDDGQHSCARCGMGTRPARVVCTVCEQEVMKWLTTTSPGRLLLGR